MATNVSADPATVAYLRRFVTNTAEVNRIYEEAWQSFSKRQLHVTIKSVSLEGGAGNGDVEGDPAVLMAACEVVLAEREGARSESMASHFNFSRRRIET